MDEGKVRVVVFSDLECPACAGFDRASGQMFDRYRRTVAVTFVHFPLPQHRFARPAARAAECAGRAGNFREFVAAVFDKQDSLGLKSWNSYASEAGILDTLQFMKCVTSRSAFSRIDSGVAVGRRIGVHVTPTVIINGWMFTGAPTESDFMRAIDAANAGRKGPF